MICTGFDLSSCFSPTPYYPSNYNFWCSALMVYVIIIRAVRNLCIGESLKREIHIFSTEEIGKMILFFYRYYRYWWVECRIYLEILGDTCTSPVFINITHLDCLDLWIHTSSYNAKNMCPSNLLFVCIACFTHRGRILHQAAMSGCVYRASDVLQWPWEGWIYTEWELRNEDLIVSWFGDVKSLFLLISVGYLRYQYMKDWFIRIVT